MIQLKPIHYYYSNPIIIIINKLIYNNGQRQQFTKQQWLSTIIAKNNKVGVHKTFMDRCVLRCMGGKGGDGCLSYEHIAPGKKSPNGGHGGRGGDVELIASNTIKDLSLSSFHIEAEPGTHGSSNGRVGKQGRTKQIRVPTGTVVYLRKQQQQPTRNKDEDDNATRTATGFHKILLADLNVNGDSVIAAKGGSPGRGNIIKVQSSFQFYEREIKPHEKVGKVGEQVVLELELKTIADVGLVGYPNAGKSSLLGAISNSRPKTAPYPFTTLHPIVGYVEFSDSKKISVADLPGLVDGAHENRGLGHSFLQHIERTRVIVFVIDVSTDREMTWTRGHLTPGEDLKALIRELELYQPGLATTFPNLVVANKMDLPGAEDGYKALQHVCSELGFITKTKKTRLFPISAVTGQGLEEFITELRVVMEENKMMMNKKDDELPPFETVTEVVDDLDNGEKQQQQQQQQIIVDENNNHPISHKIIAKDVVIGQDIKLPRIQKGVGHRQAIMMKKLKESRGGNKNI
jgi:GTP-binding protein